MRSRNSTRFMSDTEIVIRGAREHNLRNVSLSLPRNRLIVMTGVSGSGKSSLAFDTLYADGQRRYGMRAQSDRIIERLEEATGLSILADGFPTELVDTEPEEPGYEVTRG